MKLSSILRAVVATALLTVSTAAASAQSAAPDGAASSAAPTPWAAVPAGTYQLDVQLTERVMPATVIVTDSSGVAAATFHPEGDQEAHRVKATIKGTELYLNGDAPKGPFEMVLLRQGDQITGRWSYAGESGKLTGKVGK
ncbi:MAG TPA: hypothetical protein VFS59_04355 [Gemmatimonadaceae bacterium]|nr:hypothetical protein [Gemmatimonadaceae bacterium]